MRAKRADANQPEIVRTFRDCGATVQHTYMVGQGCPDAIIGVRGVTIVSNNLTAKMIEELLGTIGLLSEGKVYEGANLLVEIKDGNKPPGQRQLTSDEKEWHSLWRGQVAIVENNDQAAELVGAQ